MRIESSTITMSAARNYTAEAMESQTTITRRYNGDALERVTASTTSTQISQFEAEGGTAVFSTSAAGVTRTDQSQLDYTYTDSQPKGSKGPDRGSSLPQVVSVPSADHWISQFSFDGTEYLRKLMELLERLTGRKVSWRGHELPVKEGYTARNAFKVSAASASMRYQEVVALVSGKSSGSSGQAVSLGGQGAAVNGHWTRQTVQSGFVAGQENTAFSSKGTVVTSDGRTIDFGISLEMSRSFEAAYVSAGKEEIYTDPLVINLDTDAASLSDVSFYFDLNCDGVAEEMSALDSASGFLALDKNGDGEINNGSELFGAKTGDGFGELAQYDQDGNGWIDEGDDIFSKLSVWTSCGGESRRLSLSEADVGAIFLGSQNTQYSLMDSAGQAGAMIRKTGIYLKESGQVGTVQHVDFKA